jgi:hypothetical protein
MSDETPTTQTLMPFGKYRDQPIEVLAADPRYCEWLAAQPWFRTRFTHLHTLIVNNFAAGIFCLRWRQISTVWRLLSMEPRVINGLIGGSSLTRWV